MTVRFPKDTELGLFPKSGYGDNYTQTDGVSVVAVVGTGNTTNICWRRNGQKGYVEVADWRQKKDGTGGFAIIKSGRNRTVIDDGDMEIGISEDPEISAKYTAA